MTAREDPATVARLFRVQDGREMPWKNGGGTTLELARWPAHDDGGVPGFHWRASVARIDAGGPFSRFDSVTRLSMLAQGSVLVLDIAGVGCRLEQGSAQVVRYPGDAPVVASLPAGPVRLFNLMVAPGRRARLSRRSLRRPRRLLVPPDGQLLVLAQDGPADVALQDGPNWQLSEGDWLVLHTRRGCVLRVAQGAAARGVGSVIAAAVGPRSAS